MLARLLLGLLANAPALIEEIEDAVAELRSARNGAAKLSAAAEAAAAISQTLNNTVAKATETKEPEHG